MLFSEARGRKVVSTATAETVGVVDGFVVDPSTRKVLSLQLRKTHGNDDSLLWSDIAAFGADAVTVDDAGKLTEPGEDVEALTGKDHALVGKRVLSSAGDELGKVSDVDFDPSSGAIAAIVLGGGDGDGEVAGAHLVGVGSYAVVVRAT